MSKIAAQAEVDLVRKARGQVSRLAETLDECNKVGITVTFNIGLVKPEPNAPKEYRVTSFQATKILAFG